MTRTIKRPTPGRGWDALANPVPGNVLACLEELGVEGLRQLGEEIGGKCPAHVERTGKVDRHPSWSVNAETGVHNCFSCGFRGPFVSLVEYLRGAGRSDAVEWTRARGGIERVKKILNSYINDLVESNDTTKQINEASLALYTMPPDEALASREIDAGSAEHYGVLWEPTKELWILPIRDPGDGTLLGWQEKNARYFRNRPRDVKKSTTLFGLDAFEGTRAILVESPLDAAKLHTLGWDGALATFGAEVSETQMRLVRSLADEVVVAMDNDIAGLKSARALRQAWSHSTRMRFFNYAGIEAKDVGDMTPDEIERGIEKSINSIMFR